MRRVRLDNGYPGKNSRFILLFLSSCLLSSLASCPGQQPVYQEPLVKGTDVAIDVSILAQEKPIFLTFHYHGKNINFFVLKTGDRVISFLDACARCYSSKLGYRAGEGSITCRTCNVQYSLSTIEQGVGSCFPIRIEGHLKGGEYLIPVSSLEESADKF